jgi:hypothetical protein
MHIADEQERFGKKRLVGTESLQGCDDPGRESLALDIRLDELKQARSNPF